MDIFTFQKPHDYDFSPEPVPDANAAYASADVFHDHPLTTAFSCAGTAGTFGTAGGCVGTFGTFGSSNCGGPPTPKQPR
jgi:hypothetical protein